MFIEIITQFLGTLLFLFQLIRVENVGNQPIIMEPMMAIMDRYHMHDNHHIIDIEMNTQADWFVPFI